MDKNTTPNQDPYLKDEYNPDRPVEPKKQRAVIATIAIAALVALGGWLIYGPEQEDTPTQSTDGSVQFPIDAP